MGRRGLGRRRHATSARGGRRRAAVDAARLPRDAAPRGGARLPARRCPRRDQDHPLFRAAPPAPAAAAGAPAYSSVTACAPARRGSRFSSTKTSCRRSRVWTPDYIGVVNKPGPLIAPQKGVLSVNVGWFVILAATLTARSPALLRWARLLPLGISLVFIRSHLADHATIATQLTTPSHRAP